MKSHSKTFNNKPINITGIILLISIAYIICILLLEQYCRYHKKTLIQILHPDWFNSLSSMESSFPPVRNITDYWNKIYSGYEKMQKCKIVFGGLCMNIAPQIQHLKRIIGEISGKFADFRLIIFENDSTDGTRNLINEWCLSDSRIVLLECSESVNCKLRNLSAKNHGVMSGERMRKMCNYRNRVLDYARNKYSDFDCVGMLDLDIEGFISCDGIAHSFGCWDEWDSISAFGLMGNCLTLGQPFYYDSLAYDDGEYAMAKVGWHCIPAFFKLLKYKRGDSIFPVLSGFCGMALYKMKVFNDDRVNYTPVDGHYYMDHNILHDNMRLFGYDRIFVNPNMLLLVGAQGPYDKYPLY